MADKNNPLDLLIDELAKLPGVGSKTAARLALHILNQPETEALSLAQAIADVKQKVRHCSLCWNITAVDPCHICSDGKRDRSVICVVERQADLLAIENTGDYRGLYHILMGALSPIEGRGPDDLTADALLARLGSGEVCEVIIATNPTIDGETTAHYLAEQIRPLGVQVSRIAQGVPVGSNIEYADRVTMGRALAGRRPLE